MRNRKVIQILAIVLVVLLVGGVVVGALVSALAESPAAQASARDRYEIAMRYFEAEQALQIEQRLVYVNRTADRLDRVTFNAAANMFRRESALMYEPDDLGAVFPRGYAPGGIELESVRVNGAEADYGFVGEDELSLRVACDLRPGERCEFEFDYYLVLTPCRAFIGAGETDVRLSAFYFIPGVYDDAYREFIINKPLSFTRWLYSGAGDYDVSLTLPAGYDVACVGTLRRSDSEDGALWHMTAKDVREFALSFGRRYRPCECASDSGLPIRILGGTRDLRRIAAIAGRAVDRCEAWFGAFPFDGLTVAESDYPLGALNYPGYIRIPSALFDKAREDELEKQLRFCIAQQYFGLSAYVEPSADAWLSDSVCEYIAYLLLEAEEGRDAFLSAVNRDWVSALQLTIPGGLNVVSDASRFDSYEYGVVVLARGAVVLHELREAMGLDELLEGLAGFYRMGQGGGTLTELDFVSCMDAASGRSWEDFLTDWAFNVGDYVNQSIDWFT